MNFKVYGFIEFARIGVPVFLMLSGALLLNREIDITDFLKKRLARLTYPFIFLFNNNDDCIFYIHN